MKEVIIKVGIIISCIGFLFYIQVVNLMAEEVIFKEDFEKSKQEIKIEGKAYITEKPEEVISGKRSLKADSMDSSFEWNVFARTKKEIKLKGGAIYIVSFDYKILERGEKSYFYFFSKAYGCKTPEEDKNYSRGWTAWRNGKGCRGHKEIVLNLPQGKDYYFFFGIHRKGSIVIDNIKVVKIK